MAGNTTFCNSPPNLSHFFFKTWTTGLDVVVVVPPAGLLRVLGAGPDVELVVWGAFLFLCRGEHGYDREANGRDGQRGAPVLRQDRQADVSITVDVRVHRYVVALEDDFRGVEGVLRPELEAQRERLARVQRVRHRVHVDLDRPDGEVVAKRLAVRDFETFRRVAHQRYQLLSEAPHSNSRDSTFYD